MQAKLHLVKGNPQGKQVEIPPGTLTVGRAEDSALIIASTRVSRHHCEFVNEENRLLLRDKRSGNGTLVNGVKIHEQVLRPGDEVQIGPLTFAVEIDGVRVKAARPAASAKAAPTPAKAAAPRDPAAELARALAAKAAPSKTASGRAAPAKAAPPPRPGAKAPLAASSGKRAVPEDVLSSLERLAGGGKKPGQVPPAKAKKDNDILEISDQDLLDNNDK